MNSELVDRGVTQFREYRSQLISEVLQCGGGHNVSTSRLLLLEDLPSPRAPSLCREEGVAQAVRRADRVRPYAKGKRIENNQILSEEGRHLTFAKQRTTNVI